MQMRFVNFGKDKNMNILKRLFYSTLFILITGSSVIPAIFFLSSFNLFNNDRDDVRLLKDAEYKKIDWTPKEVTVSYLSSFVQPYPKDKSFNKNIRFGYEFNCYELTCLIKSYSIDNDGDYNLVLMDIRDTLKTIKAELVNPENNSQAKKSNFANSFSQTIIEFNKYLKIDSTLSYASFKVIGVAFFNSDNKIELSPLMDFQIKEKLR
jgi:hypothetical protein